MIILSLNWRFPDFVKVQLLVIRQPDAKFKVALFNYGGAVDCAGATLQNACCLWPIFDWPEMRSVDSA